MYDITIIGAAVLDVLARPVSKKDLAGRSTGKAQKGSFFQSIRINIRKRQFTQGPVPVGDKGTFGLLIHTIIGAAVLDVLARPVSKKDLAGRSCPADHVTLTPGGDAANELTSESASLRRDPFRLVIKERSAS